MAFYDDRKFLLSHIHHSFITCDDTGMCEMVMLNDVVTDKPLNNIEGNNESAIKVLDYYSSALESELLEAGQSYDIASDMELIGAHRHRSNTAQRLERLKKERQNQAKIRNVQWKDNPTPLSDVELSQLFPKKDLSKKQQEQQQEEKKSALAEALELFPAALNNPFNEYTRFDGKINRIAQTKKIMIFLTMLPPGEREYPMEVISTSNAKVQDLIGLICWQYTNEEREPKLKPNALCYCLRIAEETGEVDEDFPNLDPKELVTKFGFPVLALVEKEATIDSTPLITMHIEEEFTKLEIPNLDVTLREVVEQIRRHRKWLSKSRDFHIEKQDEPGIPLSLDYRIAQLGTLEYRLIWEDTSVKDAVTDEWDLQQMTAMEAPLYQSFIVSMIQKVGRNYDIQLGISGEKVEINPLPQKGAVKLLIRQQKAATYYMDTIASCEMISKKYNAGKAVFKLVQHNGQEFKSHLFETDNKTAHEIVKKLQFILDMHSSQSRKEYQLHRERKLQKKLQRNQHSFSS